MKKILLATTISALSFTAFANSDYSGHRIGAGINNLSFSDSGYTYKMGTGFKLEYGYDFNRIVSANASYTMNSDSDHGIDIDFNAFNIDTDIGYAFDLDNVWVKPYGAIGLSNANAKLSFAGMSDSERETNLYLGIGVRAQFNMGLYTDLRANIGSHEGLDADHLSLTVGYRF
ncbi:porin family protein [Vibrio sp. E150_011]